MLQPPLTVEKLLSAGAEFNEASIRAMEAVYHPRVRFRDPIQSLEGRDEFIEMNLRMIQKMDVSFELLRHWVAPHFTVVVDGANGLRDFGASCLNPAD